MNKLVFLEEKATQIRRDLLKMIVNAGTGHTAGSLSNTDIMTVLFYEVMDMKVDDPDWEDRDRFILSKGHSVESYYTILADKGYFDKEELNTFCQYKSRLIGHPNNKVPGVEMNTGALGHGLAIATGIAKAAKMSKKDYKVYTLMGDGEQAEGSVWEAAMAASHFKLDNLVGIVDRNNLQITDNTERVMTLEPLAEKWKSFGWEVIEVDGHNYQELIDAFSESKKNNGKPTLVLANTIKGKGVSFMENKVEWHHGLPSAEELAQALEELSSQKEVKQNV
ncbi:transketolase [Halanaerobium saccharolyticum]|uniref:Transketolase n=1 Tax=Halanaerobium saccharolyticum TaxID=43595 RepID=A0A4R7YSM4_9FIRM|nr:transketolase [Halanaerobium saccharolyticum]RAK06289.1 transketolase [Halanaerobium saccharolyticum]TDW00768.1 transketolase [Halanaerobium saccharolyticum]TDX52410.1 transketolase [Halanaerobium saccharolyticum]